MTIALSGFKSHGIREPLTNRIAGILDEYPDGTQIARELLQNSDDARSTEQWYLLDHHSYIDNTERGDDLRLFHEDLKEYMGPALLAGNDSLFEDRDFKSMKNLAASEKRNDETKIGQMGIGFNSIYHMTDCPSFISGDQFMVIEPHERIFNGIRSEFTEGAVRGSFAEESQGLRAFPDQLGAFSVLRDIDFTQPYPGTIFRFPLRTEDQAATSKLSSNAYPAEQVLKMLLKLKNEALKAMLFLKHIEKISIYERKNLKEGPKKIFEIEITNVEEVRRERQGLLAKLKDHVHAEPTGSRDAILQYSVRPIFKLTQEDETSTLEHWQISTIVGNVLASRDYMKEETDGNLNAHKLIPWVGIAAPSEPDIKIASSGLFCFLPISIQLPFPVHINGHFAVKQSRREIWTNQDNDFAKHASAYIKSVWNVHLFNTHVPVVYAKFLADLGLARSANYDLWPTSCGLGIGLDAIWKDLLSNLLQVICRDNLKVFFCKSEDDGDYRLVDYRSLWIAGRDTDKYPLLVKTLQELTDVAVGLPAVVLQTIPDVVGSLGLENRILTPALVRRLLREHKNQWTSMASSKTRVEILRYCIKDGDIKDLEGLPLLPLSGGLWVEFSISKSHERYLVKQEIFTVLSHSDDGLVDIEFDKYLVMIFYSTNEFHVFWSEIDSFVISARIKDTYDRLFYNESPKTKSCILQSVDGFPTTKWILDFWTMVRSLTDQKSLLEMVEGIHLLPTTRQRLAPLARELPVIYLDRSKDNNRSTLVPFVKTLDGQLDCRVMREYSGDWEGIAADYIFEVSDACKVLGVLSEIPSEDLVNIDQGQSKTVCQYMSRWLLVRTNLDDRRLRTLKTLPIYQTYDESAFVSLQYPESNQSKWRVAKEFSHTLHPWLPKSVSLLADGQPMLEHLTNIIGIPTTKESGYWFEILGHLRRFSENEWDSIIEKFCEKYHTHCNHHDIAAILIDLEFVRTVGPRPTVHDLRSISTTRLSPRDIVNPALSSYFAENEIVFPSGVYAEPSVLSALIRIGIRSAFDAAFVLDRVEQLSDRARIDGVDSIRGVLLDFYAKLNADFSNDFRSTKMQNSLRQRSWILARTSGDDDYKCCDPVQCRPESERALLGSQMPLSQFQFTNKSLTESMGWDQQPPLDKVLVNFSSLIEQANLQNQNGNSKLDEVRFIEIYRYLMKQIKDDKALSTMKEALNHLPWILADGALYPVDRVALSMSLELTPHFVQIKLSGLDDFFIAMGVREAIGQADLQGIVSKIGSQYGKDEPLSAKDVEFVIKLLKGIAFEGVNESHDLLILTQDNRLCNILDVVYDNVGVVDDASNSEDINQTYTFANSQIIRSVAETLKIPMYSTSFWHDQRDLSFEPWAQEEDILVRIRNILNDYDPSSIFVEFLQNAADAGATKCSFMLDERKYGDNKVLSEKMAVWQGPALLIYNDAEFSEDDFNALCKLGEGSKREDSRKIGRHGVGFNSVYHFTDVPSVVSGSYIGFFDPLHEYLPELKTPNGYARQGGQRCKIVNLQGPAFSDQLEPYMESFGCDMKSHYKGTIFRIPLRMADNQEKTSRKSITNNIWELSQIRKMLRDWAEDGKLGMLFLDNIMNIEIIGVSDNPSDECNFSWSAVKSFANEKPHLNRALHKGNDPSNVTRMFDIGTSSSSTLMTESQRWLVHTDVEYPPDTLQAVKDLATTNRWRPCSGVAFPLNWPKNNSFIGKLFTHLPTPIMTGLPFHIHGGFALMSNRKGLAGGTDTMSSQFKWNEFMKRDCLPLTAVTAMEKLLIWQFWGLTVNSHKARDIGSAITAYYKYWPTNPRTDFESFVQKFSRSSHSHPVHPVLAGDPGVHARFMCGRDVVFPELDHPTIRIGNLICKYERTKGVGIGECSPEIQAQLRSDWKDPKLRFSAMDEDYIRNIIKEDPNFIPEKVMKNGEQRYSIDDVRWILEYTLRVILETKRKLSKVPVVPVIGLHLLPMMDNTWKPLGLFSPCYTATAEMRSLIKGEEYLIDESIFASAISTTLSSDMVPSLEQIFKKLSSDDTYGITQLPPTKFTSIFNSENPNGTTEDQRERLWRLLEKSEDFDAYGELPILKTLNGTMVPLKFYKNGIEISHLTYMARSNAETLSSLMVDLGLIVFDALQNYRNPSIIRVTEEATVSMILKSIAVSCATLPNSRVISTEEAEVLREMIKEGAYLSNPELESLGNLRIWSSWSAVDDNTTPHLIPARGSFFMEGEYSLEHLGDDSDVIRGTYRDHYGAMGARPLTVVTAAESRVMPRLLDNVLDCNEAQTKGAYIKMLLSIARVASIKKGGHRARNFLLSRRFILARDGTFHTTQELLDPSDSLLPVVFEGETSKFPDSQLWQRISASQKCSLFMLRDSRSTGMIRECALHVLDLTGIDSTTLPHPAKVPAEALIRHIYQNSDDISWMNPDWNIVPAEVASDSPYSMCVPEIPAFMSFSGLVDPSYRDVCWTQCAFFSENMKPSESFRARFPSVGKPKLRAVIQHLSVIVEDLSPKWVTLDDQLALKVSLFKVYKFLEDISKESGTEDAANLKSELAKLHVPFILNGDDKDPSLSESWSWPNQLMLDIDNDIEMHQVVHNKLKPYRGFLVAAGVEEMKDVEARIEVPEGRDQCYIGKLLLNCFESQDMLNGFMDVQFRFANGNQIFAHKVVLANSNERLSRQFTGLWAEHAVPDPSNPKVDLIDLSNVRESDETYEAFWGLIFYFYTNRLISTNGPPVLLFEQTTNQTHDDPWRDRVQYLMELLCLADQYQESRLKALIAAEIVHGKKAKHSNVFNIRKFAMLYSSNDIKGYCEKYLTANTSSVRTYLNGEIQVQRRLLMKLSGEGSIEKREEIGEYIKELEENLRELDSLV
ncbi:hypothetical protein BGZ79_000911 [Entomortierella chlamydospora]|nr:hypothetical protein BGZ79_000911 [Entomortierella chlamydospora]